VSAPSPTLGPEIEILGPSGVSLGVDHDSGVDSDSLLAIRQLAGPTVFPSGKMTGFWTGAVSAPATLRARRGIAAR
jgi:hypothetical protein